MNIIISCDKKSRGFEFRVVNTNNWVCTKQTMRDFTTNIRNGFVYDNVFLCVKKKAFENIKYLLKKKVYLERGNSYLIPCDVLPKSIFNNCESLKLSECIKTAKVDDVLSDLHFYYDADMGIDKDVFHIDRGDEYSIYGKFNARNNYSVYVKCRGYEYNLEVTPERFILNGEPYGGLLRDKYKYGKVKYIYIMPNRGLRIAIKFFGECEKSDVYFFCTDICTARLIYPSSMNVPFYGDVVGKEIR